MLTDRERSLVARLAAGEYAVRDVCLKVAREHRDLFDEDALYVEYVGLEQARWNGRGDADLSRREDLRELILERRPPEAKRPLKRPPCGPKKRRVDDGG